MTDFNGGLPTASHLVVLVHGLWGQPAHMRSAARALREKYPEDELHILVTQKNAGNLTYDGVETGGERVCTEIEDELAAVRKSGGEITKLSVVGYSLGGLIARYAIGLLHSKGELDNLECMNFTAFASPFLGTRSPLKGLWGRLVNSIGPRALSQSGKQLFGVDKFRDTGRPLLALMADPDSIFMEGLARFKRRTLYANVENDRTAVYYTTAISKTDPFQDLSKVSVRYAAGYEDVVLDRDSPVAPLPEGAPSQKPRSPTDRLLYRTVYIALMMMFIPVGVTALMGNAALQAVHSTRRIREHEGQERNSRFRVPLLREIRETVEDAYARASARQGGDYLDARAGGSDSDSGSDDGGRVLSTVSSGASAVAKAGPEVKRRVLRRERRMSNAAEPTLALAPEQFEMANALNDLGWRKYPVWIHKIQHSHAAIVLRSEAARYSEGKIVLAHWVNEEFLI